MPIRYTGTNNFLTVYVDCYNKGHAKLMGAEFTFNQKQSYFANRFQNIFFAIAYGAEKADATWYADKNNKRSLLDELENLEHMSNDLRMPLIKNGRELRLLKIELMSKWEYILYQADEVGTGVSHGVLGAITAPFLLIRHPIVAFQGIAQVIKHPIDTLSAGVDELCDRPAHTVSNLLGGAALNVGVGALAGSLCATTTTTTIPSNIKSIIPLPPVTTTVVTASKTAMVAGSSSMTVSQMSRVSSNANHDQHAPVAQDDNLSGENFRSFVDAEDAALHELGSSRQTFFGASAARATATNGDERTAFDVFIAAENAALNQLPAEFLSRNQINLDSFSTANRTPGL